MKKLLLTGFEPFLHHTLNPTMDIAKELDGKTIGNYEIVSKILPVTFSESGEELLSAIKEVQPDAVVSLGLAGDRRHITPERIAINCKDGAKDNNGVQMTGEKIVEEGEDGMFTTLPVQKMVEALKDATLPASISNSAGAYVCNHVMYHALYYFKQENITIPSGFIHIPPSHALALEQKNVSSMSHDDLVRGIQICMEQIS
ncbi:MAG TPA: pyroglutamyl-peptidase I [Bacillota bacterium]|nr:pyroglutamyl-peptidase I [Bacillota bacterium]